jgi:U3 small nucleolar RNA-associated protein 12
MLDGIRNNLREALKRQKDEMGYNLAALRVVGSQVREKGVKQYIDEEIWDEEDKKNQRKRGFVHVS